MSDSFDRWTPETMASIDELRGFQQCADARASEERVLSLSCHPSPEIRRQAASTLAAHASYSRFRDRLMAMFGDEDRNVARKAVLEAKFHRIAPSDQELERALKNPNDQIASWTVLLIGDLEEATLIRLLGAVGERPTLARSILPKLEKHLGDSRVRKVFLEACVRIQNIGRGCPHRRALSGAQIGTLGYCL